MGALSSWAMLALTHHIIVQFCAHRVGYEGWFPYYAILGDDVVVANDNVALEYLRIMKKLGVGISLAKTLRGESISMEFAYRFILNGVDVSPLSTLEFLAGSANMSAFLTLFAKGARLVRLTLSDAAKALGWRHRGCGSVGAPFRTLGKRLQGLILLFTRPGAPLGWDSVMDWLFSVSATAKQEVADEFKWRLVQSFEDTFATSIGTQFQSLQRKVVDISKLPGEFPRPKGRRDGQILSHWLFGDFGWKGVKPSVRKHLLSLGEYVRTEILFKIQEELLVKMDDLEQLIYWNAQYYRASETLSPKAPMERLEALLEVDALLEDQIASVPTVENLWRKPAEVSLPSSSKALLRWRSVSKILSQDKSSTVEVRPDRLAILSGTLSLAKRAVVNGSTETQQD
jgi:hypothetical protein